MVMTAKELLEKKKVLIDRKHATVDVNIYDVGVWRFAVPTGSDIVDSVTYAENHKRECRNDELALVYFQLVEPNLKDEELVKSLAADLGREANPGPWIVDALLLSGEVKRVSEILLKKAGYGNSAEAVVEAEVKGGEEIKNS